MRTAVLAAFAAALPSSLAAQAPGTYTLRGDNAAVYDLAGSIRVEPGTGDAIAVQVTPGGADGARLRVVQGTVRGRDALRVIFPSDRIRYSKLSNNSTTTLEVQDDGTFGDEARGGRRVQIGGAGDEAWADVRIAVPPGRRLTVRLAVGAVTLTNVDGRIEVGAASAPITASGGRGELKLETGSGNIEVTRFQGERVALQTGSGDVSATGMEVRGVAVGTGSGDVRLTDLRTPRASIETGSGDVTVDLRADVESLTVQTGSGDVTVTAPPTLGAAVNFQTGSGDIVSEFPLGVTRSARDHVTGTVGDGQGRILVETGSGSVRLTRRSGAG